MKRLFCIIFALILVVTTPVSAFAAGNDNEVSPLSVITVKSSITRSSSITAKISATTQYDSTIELSAKAQLQWKIDGVWRNFGAAVTNTATSQSVTASTRITLTPGYEYRVKGIHRIGVQTKYSYSETMQF